MMFISDRDVGPLRSRLDSTGHERKHTDRVTHPSPPPRCQPDEDTRDLSTKHRRASCMFRFFNSNIMKEGYRHVRLAEGAFKLLMKDVEAD